MKFREITEIRTSEKISDNTAKEEESENWKQIKPETDMTADEARKFWDDVFKMEFFESEDYV